MSVLLISIVGVIVVAIAAFLVWFFLLRKKGDGKKKKKDDDDDSDDDDAGPTNAWGTKDESGDCPFDPVDLQLSCEVQDGDNVCLQKAGFFDGDEQICKTGRGNHYVIHKGARDKD